MDVDGSVDGSVVARDVIVVVVVSTVVDVVGSVWSIFVVLSGVEGKVEIIVVDWASDIISAVDIEIVSLCVVVMQFTPVQA